MPLSDIEQRFVVHWGEMGSRWGINRTVAQIHARLYLSPEPLHAEQIQADLGVARSNVSNSLRELQAWGLVKRVHVLGDRRDRFVCDGDGWDLLRKVLDERKRREIDPSLAALRECVAAAGGGGGDGSEIRRRLAELLEVLELADRWYARVRALPAGALRRFLQVGDRLVRPGPDTGAGETAMKDGAP